MYNPNDQHLQNRLSPNNRGNLGEEAQYLENLYEKTDGTQEVIIIEESEEEITNDDDNVFPMQIDSYGMNQTSNLAAEQNQIETMNQSNLNMTEIQNMHGNRGSLGSPQNNQTSSTMKAIMKNMKD